jgi:uncharacterized protein YjiS (DUF1127 family)
MTTISNAPAAAQGTTGHPWTGRLAGALKRWWVAYITWRLEQVVIDQLWPMSDRYLKDIGLTRSEITIAVKGDATRNRYAIEKKVGNLRRFFDAILDAMHESRRRQAEREIVNFIARQGGHLTDDLEREMTRRLFTSNWSPRE